MKNKTSRKKFFDAITNYINGDISDFSELYMLGNNSVILNYLKDYANAYPERSYEINILIDNLDELRYSKYEKDSLLRVLESHYDRYNSKYVKFIIELLEMDEIKTINYFKKNDINVKTLKSSLEQFSKLFKNQTNEIDYIKNVINKYEIECSKASKKTDYINVSLFYDQTDKDYINNRFESLYISKLSIEEFCSLTGESLVNTKVTVETYLKNEKYCDKAKEILARTSSKEFYNNILSLAYEIDTNESFDAIDYYGSTRLKNSDFRDILSNLVERTDLIRIVKKLNSIVKISNVNKTFELKSKKIISGREIKLEEKEMIFKYLEDNNLPIGLYNVALKKYLNNNLKILKK